MHAKLPSNTRATNMQGSPLPGCAQWPSWAQQSHPRKAQWRTKQSLGCVESSLSLSQRERESFKRFPSFFLVGHSIVVLESNTSLGERFLRVLRCPLNEDLFPTDLPLSLSLPQPVNINPHFQPCSQETYSEVCL